MSKLTCYHAFINEHGKVRVNEHEYVSEDCTVVFVTPNIELSNGEINYFYKHQFLTCNEEGAITCDKNASLELLKQYHEDNISRACKIIDENRSVVNNIEQFKRNEEG